MSTGAPDDAMMVEEGAQLPPETSATPRGGRQAEPSAAERDDPTLLPLGSFLELRWDNVTQLPAEWLERMVRGATQQRDGSVELQLRAVAQSRSQSVPVTPSTSKVSLAASTAALPTWALPTSASVVHVALTPELLLPGATENGETFLLVMVVSLQPRRSSREAWALSFTLAMDMGMIRRVHEKALSLDVPMCDQDGVGAGVAQIRLRCGDVTAHMTLWDEAGYFLQHIKRPAQARLSLVQIQRVSSERKPLAMVLEIATTGQEYRRAVRTRAWTLDPMNPVGVEVGEVLLIDDAWTQALRFTVLQHSPKERAYRLAEGVVSLSKLEDENGESKQQSVRVQMRAVGLDHQQRSTSNRRENGEDVAVWGELTVSALVNSPISNKLVEAKRSAAAALLKGDSGYAVAPTDAKGTLEIELHDVVVEGLAERSDLGGSLRVSLTVHPSKWSAQATAGLMTPGPSFSRLTFNRERFAAPVHWTTKERVIPSLNCSLTLTQQRLQQTKHNAVSTRTSRKGKVERREDTPTTIRLEGYQSMHLPVFFACPGEWIYCALCTELNATDTCEISLVPAKLRLRVRFMTKDQSISTVATESLASDCYGPGLLSVSVIRANGSFLKNHRPQEVFAITLECSSASESPSRPNNRFVSRFPSLEENSVSWDHCLHCDLPSSSCAPIVELKLFKLVDDPQSGTGDELLGLLSLPLPLVVLRGQHLVSFTLPLVDATKARISSSRKCGTLSFDLQFVSVASTQQKLRAKRETARLLLQRLSWIETPPSLALALLQRRFALQCELSIVRGKGLSDTLWQHQTSMLDAAETLSVVSAEYVVNHTVSLSYQVIQKLSSVTDKCVLILRLSTSDCESPSIALGQAVVPLLNGWAAFAASEKDKWHKVYALGERRSQGNPEPVGEIQLSIVTEEPPPSLSDGIREVDGWLFVQVVEAVVDGGVLSQVDITTQQTQAQVELQHPSSFKPQRSKSQWGINGRWHWENDAVFVCPYVDSSEAEESTFSLALVVENEHRIVVASVVCIRPFISALRSSASMGQNDTSVDEWVFSPDGSAQLLLRVCYLPATTGIVHLEVRRLQPQCTPSTQQQLTNFPVSQLALRCSGDLETSAVVTSPTQPVPPPGTDHYKHWGLVEGIELELPLTTTSSPRPILPSIKLQLMAYALGMQETCLAETVIPITSAMLRDGTTSTQWISLHARHDASQRVAIASLRLGFQRKALGLNSRLQHASPSLFTAHEHWQQACASVLVLWKRLFYKLDIDHNGRIDAAEFRSLFMAHSKVFRETHDGETLLRILLSPHEKIDGDPFTSSWITRLFSDMDHNDDQTIEWTEYVDFLQSKLLLLEPPRVTENSPDPQNEVELRHPEKTTTFEPSASRELRRKRREDPSFQQSNTVSTSLCKDENGVASQCRLSVRQLRSVNREERDLTSHVDAADLFTKVQTAEALLDLERQKSTRLHDELRMLRLAFHQLQLQQERHRLEETTKEAYLHDAIQNHEASLRDRAARRRQHHTASIVLQSKVRSRLEQKKFQALKLQRSSAALRLQCAYRTWRARRVFTRLQEAERLRQRRHTAAAMLQRFVRFHVGRKERLLLREARHLSATVLQKYARRLLVVQRRRRYLDAAVVLQCWHRRLTAKRYAQQLRLAFVILKHWLVGKVWERRWAAMCRGVRRVQRWWRRANDQRWERVTRLEAVMCIQAVWRGNRQRQKWRSLDACASEESVLDSPVNPIKTVTEKIAEEVDKEPVGDIGVDQHDNYCSTGVAYPPDDIVSVEQGRSEDTEPGQDGAKQTSSKRLTENTTDEPASADDATYHGDQRAPPEESIGDIGVVEVDTVDAAAAIDAEIVAIAHALVAKVVECLDAGGHAIVDSDASITTSESATGRVEVLCIVAGSANDVTSEEESFVSRVEGVEGRRQDRPRPNSGEDETQAQLYSESAPGEENADRSERKLTERGESPTAENASSTIDPTPCSDAGEPQAIRELLEEVVAAVESRCPRKMETRSQGSSPFS